MEPPGRTLPDRSTRFRALRIAFGADFRRTFEAAGTSKVAFSLQRYSEIRTFDFSALDATSEQQNLAKSAPKGLRETPGALQERPRRPPGVLREADSEPLSSKQRSRRRSKAPSNAARGHSKLLPDDFGTLLEPPGPRKQRSDRLRIAFGPSSGALSGSNLLISTATEEGQ